MFQVVHRRLFICAVQKKYTTSERYVLCVFDVYASYDMLFAVIDVEINI